MEHALHQLATVTFHLVERVEPLLGVGDHDRVEPLAFHVGAHVGRGAFIHRDHHQAFRFELGCSLFDLVEPQVADGAAHVPVEGEQHPLAFVGRKVQCGSIDGGGRETRGSGRGS